MNYLRGLVLLTSIFTITACNSAPTNWQLNADDFEKTLHVTNNAVLLDVRTAGEYGEGHIDEALNFDYNTGNFTDNFNQWDKTKTYFVYCKSGKRSAAAAAEMRKAGFANVYELDGGFISWSKAKKEIKK